MADEGNAVGKGCEKETRRAGEALLRYREKAEVEEEEDDPSGWERDDTEKERGDMQRRGRRNVARGKIEEERR